jgi:hypothetical protein
VTPPIALSLLGVIPTSVLLIVEIHPPIGRIEWLNFPALAHKDAHARDGKEAPARARLDKRLETTNANG